MDKHKLALKRDVNKFLQKYFTDSEIEEENEDKEMSNTEKHMCSSSSTYSFLDESQEQKDITADKPSIHEELINIRDQLAQWAVEENVPNASVSKLLKILKPILKNLPTDARTLKGTPRFVPTKSLKGGNYVHYGVRDSLTDFLRTEKIENNYLELNFNVDGLPLSKSSGAQVWPILMSVAKSTNVFLVGVYEGYSKPEDIDSYLEMFVKELEDIFCEGFVYCEQYFTVKIGAFICDAPARSMLLGIKGHSGYYCCHKCSQRGERYDNKIIFPHRNDALRTDEHFRSRMFPEHHNIQQPIMLEKLPMDIVSTFPMDYMHVACLGVMKSILKCLVNDRGKFFSLNPKKIKILNDHLNKIRNDVPAEFARKPRSVHELKRWKATEFRMFLIYIGPVVLKYVLDSERYRHFLQFSLGINILLRGHKENINIAESLLNDFVRNVPILYDKSKLTYNMHCLTHLANDCRNMGPLHEFGAFKFENFLQKIKHKIKKKKQFCAQVYNRTVEYSCLAKLEKINKQGITLGNIIDGSYTFIKIYSKHFSIKHPNNYFFANNRIHKINSIVKENNEYFVYSRHLKIEYHLDSDTMFNRIALEFENNICKTNFNDIIKVFEIKVHDDAYFIPLVHV